MNSPFTPRSSSLVATLQRPVAAVLLTPWLVTAGVAATPGGFGFSGLLNKPAEPKTNAVPTAAPDKKSSPTPTSLSAALDPSAGSKAESTNNPVKKDSRIQPRGNVSINARGVEYQGDSKKVTYWNKVRVDDPEDKPITTIECEWLSTVIPESREGLGEIIGLTNVVITFRGEKPEELTTARGQRVVYNATNDTLVLTGVPATVDYASGLSLSTEGPIIYERKTGSFHATGETKTIVRRALAVPAGKTEKETAPATPPGPK